MRETRNGPSHPICLAMTGLLLLNDHVLKRAFHNALTGKLSDVAFLIVAPAVLASLLTWVRCEESLARRLALVGVGAAFILLQLWPPLGTSIATWLGGTHTADPTDLLMLPTLLLTPLIWQPTRRVPLALPVAAFACVATSWGACDAARYPVDGGVLDPNEPLVLRFGFETPAADHPSVARNIEILDPDGTSVPLWFVDGIKICPQGGLRPDTRYTFVVRPFDEPSDNTYRASFPSPGPTSFSTLSSSSLPPITSLRECREAQILGELPPCTTGIPGDTGSFDSGMRDSGL